MTDYATRHFVAGDRPLRRDIRLLTWQLRRLVQRHGGTALWDALDRLRSLADHRRQGDPTAEPRIVEALAGMPVQQLAMLTRATGLYFDLANLAEDRHRVRVLRQREAQGRSTETIQQAALRLKQANVSDRELRDLLSGLEIEPVLTAHPTEAKRRSVRRGLRRLRRDLYLIDSADLLPSERGQRLVRMQRDLASLWYTDLISPRKPTVLEELGRTLFAVRTMWQVGPQVMQHLRSAFPEQAPMLNSLGRLLRFGNWIGGDRDGNPYVTCDVTRQTLARLRTAAVRLHRRECRNVRQRMTVSASRIQLPEDLKADIDRARQLWPGLARRLDRQHPDEWIVQWMVIVDQRLRYSAALPDRPQHPMAYVNAEELARDVARIEQALRQSGHDELTTGALRRWQDRLQIFGLHLLRLDIRVNSTIVCKTVTDLLKSAGLNVDYQRLDEAGRQAALTPEHAAAVGRIDPRQFDSDVADLIKVLILVQRSMAGGGGQALGQLIVSMTHQPTDVIAVVWLLQVAARQLGSDAPAPMAVVPLFETIDDLERAEQMFDSLLADPHYRAHLAACGNRQTCMLGYSDSAKDGGYLASNWALYQTQCRLAGRAQQHGIKLTVFHGRGGAIGRGGGPAARAIMSLPRHAVDGRLRVTEQGEVIAERYDDPAIARRHLEQLFWATLTVTGGQQQDDAPPHARELAQQLADTSMRAYRELIESDAFEMFLGECTPLPLVERLPIGSRPSRRSGSVKLEDLRAIPFTFAWNQVRMPINAFYGLGAAFDALSDEQRQQTVRMYQQWSWFRAVIDNAELALARCDLAVARRYAQLAGDQAAALRLWSKLSEEHDRACRAVLTIKQQKDIIDAVPWLQRTIRVRNPFVDMLNLIQVELIRRLRANGDESQHPALEGTLRLTVQAIAAGLRNTG